MTQDAATLALEELTAALNRASGVLDSLNNLYAADQDVFHGGNAFAAHAVSTSQLLLAEAAAATGQLFAALAQQRTHVNALEAEQVVLTEALERARMENQRENASETDVEHLLEEQDHEDIMAWHGAHANGDGQSTAPETMASARDSFAESYEQLLQKVTAVEVFAKTSDVGGGSQLSQELLPLVESLKDDLLKLTRVA